jgi:hypothetical protein
MTGHIKIESLELYGQDMTERHTLTKDDNWNNDLNDPTKQSFTFTIAPDDPVLKQLRKV